MAVTPESLIKSLIKEVSDYEYKIDMALLDKTFYGGSITITAPDGITHAHMQLLKKRYIDAGWKDIELKDNQRDGSYITLTANNNLMPSAKH